MPHKHKDKQKKTFSYESMGTVWEISVWDDFSGSRICDIKHRLTQASNDFDQTYSRFISSSFVLTFAQETGVFKVSQDLTTMLQLYFKLYHATNGVFTPLVGNTLSDLGYDKSYSLKPKSTISHVPPLPEVIKIIDDEHIKITQRVELDLGALGKGFFVDKAVTLLKEEGPKHFLINGSGDVWYENLDAVHNNSKKQRSIKVGLEHPDDPKKVIGMLEFTSGAMCSSGVNRRRWGMYHHIINPSTKKSTTDILATWVLADSTVVADAMATALFLASPEALQSVHAFDYLMLNKDMKVKRSDGFTAELF